MSELSIKLGVPYPSGLSINGVPVPLALEGADAPHEERVAAITGFVSDFQAKGTELALVRADATLAGADPDRAESTFTAAQRAAANPAVAPVVAQPGGAS